MTPVTGVAIVHYHLRGGGVTRVINHAVKALARQGISAVVLVGETPDEFDLKENGFRHPLVRIVEGLGYGAEKQSPAPEAIIKKMKAAAKEVLGREPEIWHFHNHNLGKNALMPALAAKLAGNGEKLLLQLHDFPEDGRPGNYSFLQHAFGDSEEAQTCLYPAASQVHYAVLNRRDQQFLADAGLAGEQNHYLPNPVEIPGLEKADSEVLAADSEGGSERFFLYPTRAIRRKNLGEFLLWSALAEPGDTFAITLAPKNPAAQPIYNNWVEFARQLELPVAFEAGIIPGSFPKLLARANAIMTTSIAEGFGLAFLEPWLAGRMLAGRALPEITAEFQAAGIELANLYERLDIPLEWLGRNAFADKVRVGLEKNYISYGRQIKPEDPDQALGAAIAGGSVDFGCLDEELQQKVIRRVRGSETARNELRASAGFARPDFKPETMGAIIKNNRERIEKNYNLEEYGKTLAGIYEKVVQSPEGKVTALSREKLLAHFLAPERFRLLRT